MSSPSAESAATLIAQDAVDKLAALDTIARAVGSVVVGAGTSRPTVPLSEGVWAQIDIPKFGEPPPLAIDVHAVAGREVALRHARDLLGVLQRATSWHLSTDFDRIR
ncbi:MAG: hypothetical protein ABW024_10880 [Microbacterium sp.]